MGVSDDSVSGFEPGKFGSLLEVLRAEADAFLPTDGPPEAQHREAFVLLLAYGCAVEKVLAAAAGRGGMLPGHRVSLRSYVEQLLQGDAEAVTVRRLEQYFNDAVSLFARSRLDSEGALQSFAERIAEQFQPERIERQTTPQPSGLDRLLGRAEAAYWREFKKEFGKLTAADVKHLGGND